eukprot:PhF_6_TR30134/c0_g1_i1/m.44073
MWWRMIGTQSSVRKPGGIYLSTPTPTTPTDLPAPSPTPPTTTTPTTTTPTTTPTPDTEMYIFRDEHYVVTYVTWLRNSSITGCRGINEKHCGLLLTSTSTPNKSFLLHAIVLEDRMPKRHEQRVFNALVNCYPTEYPNTIHPTMISQSKLNNKSICLME